MTQYNLGGPITVFTYQRKYDLGVHETIQSRGSNHSIQTRENRI